MAYISGWSAIEANLEWTIFLVDIPLSKGVKHNTEVTMTLAKIRNFVFCRVNDFKGQW